MYLHLMNGSRAVVFYDGRKIRSYLVRTADFEDDNFYNGHEFCGSVDVLFDSLGIVLPANLAKKDIKRFIKKATLYSIEAINKVKDTTVLVISNTEECANFALNTRDGKTHQRFNVDIGNIERFADYVEYVKNYKENIKYENNTEFNEDKYNSEDSDVVD